MTFLLFSNNSLTLSRLVTYNHTEQQTWDTKLIINNT